MSTQDPHDRVRKLIDRRAATRQRQPDPGNKVEVQEHAEALELIDFYLGNLRPQCDDTHQGLIDSALSQRTQIRT